MSAGSFHIAWWKLILSRIWQDKAPPWWKHFPRAESRTCRAFPGQNDKPLLNVGDAVRLKLRPDRVRRVIKSEWHRHRYEFVYIVETSAAPFEPYWFFGQLERVDPIASE